MTDWSSSVARLGLSPEAAALAARMFQRADAQHASAFGDGHPTRAWWVPGRIEVLGKHTDYGGGRSLLCAVERGFHVVAAPRADPVIHIVDASTGAAFHGRLEAGVAASAGHWTDYPITVSRRIARDFPDAQRGMDAVVLSSLPPASGLSSSSALVIACFLPLAAFNALADMSNWTGTIHDDDALAEYLGAMENGRSFGPLAADRGVGTRGGSEDHMAILRSQRGHLAQYHFLPATREATVAVPAGWRFVIGMSGVHAAKGGAVQQRYNALSQQVADLLALWQQHTGRSDPSLFAAMQSSDDAVDQFTSWLERDGAPATLRHRLRQFCDECQVIIPAATQCMRHGDVAGLGALVDRSQQHAEQILHNQVPETVHLVRSARDLGAVAASGFGAGFGGSVWALVAASDAAAFRERWHNDYMGRFGQHRARAQFFPSDAGPPARELTR